jgi:sodium transport system permease protein
VGLAHAARTAFVKELVDALRDRRTMLMVLLSSVAVGPLMLVLMSVLVADMEKRAESREIVVLGLEHAPTLRNFMARQTMRVEAPPPDYERALKDSKLDQAVLIVPPDFEERLARGERPQLEILTNTVNQRAQAGVGRLRGLLRGFAEEQRQLRLAHHGLAPEVLRVLDIEERDLADTASRGAQLAFIVPFFVMTAVLYGCFNAALDTTAGERERGSLEPLLMTPASPLALTLGKWGAVATLGMLVAVLGCFSFLPGQWLLRSEALAAMFRFGPVEALWFLALLVPLAGALAAVLMATAIRCKSFKEAQANSTVVLLAVNLVPLVQVFGRGGEEPWHLWVPALAQITLMTRVLKGEAPGALDVLVTVAVCAALTAAGLWWIARTLRQAAVR